MAAVLAAVALILLPISADAASDTKNAPGATFVRLPVIVLPVFDNNNVIRQASLVLAIEVADEKNIPTVEAAQRKLVDAFIRDLYQIYDQRRNSERLIDAPVIKARLNVTANRVLGQGVIREVLIQQAFEKTKSR